KLYPHEVLGEGHFYAVLQKTDGEEARALPLQKSNVSKKELALFLEFCKSTLKEIPKGTPYRAGDTLYLLPEGMFCVDKLSLLRAGVRAGEYNKDRFTPAHALAMSLCADQVKRTVNLSLAESEKYLRGETLEADEENGWCLVCVNGYPLGWGKVTNGIVKNHYPKGLRLVK
ncbi:MAG: RsmF rRNA methyltransferase first C-terminal domain-containing protein, partial [Clostridia bacterium]|nr:RsmF rRNA methyltransferase first C-terminal domain-containing protein [Clostridia bacterium]